MITLSNGHKLRYLAASGALAYDGKGYLHEWPLRWLGLIDPTLFTIVIKTLTYNPTKGNLKMYRPWSCIWPLFGRSLFPIGSVNAVGLTNPGYAWWMREVWPKLRREYKIIVSIKADSLHQLRLMAISLNQVRELVGVQWNVSCPNTENRDELLKNEDFIVQGCEALKQISCHPVLIKLSEQHSMNLVRRLEGLVEAIEPNSVRWDRVYPDRKSPLAHLGGGGVSGKPAQPFNWRFLCEVKSACNIPIIGNDIWKYSDFSQLDGIGVDAYSVGALFMLYPWRPTQYVRRHMREGRTDGTKAIVGYAC